MDDPKAHHAHCHLRHLVGVGVIHEGARAAQLELVDEGLALGLIWGCEVHQRHPCRLAAAGRASESSCVREACW